MVSPANNIRSGDYMQLQFRLFLIGFMLAFVMVASVAQTRAQGTSDRGATTNFRFAETNELTITVSVLGAVRIPGRYEISRSIDLLNLLSLAGGPAENGDLTDVTILRQVKTTTGTERREIKLNLEDLNELSEGYLSLQQDDFIFVGRITISTGPPVALAYITAVASLILTIVVIHDYAQRW
jgi:hypothetical protein